MKKEICCIFFASDAQQALENRDFTTLAENNWSRHEERILRCRHCGAYVLERYEETVFYSDWDDADIRIEYIPIHEPVIINGQFPDKISKIDHAPHLFTQYRESDAVNDQIWYLR